jgi:hypothetical protein
MARDMVIEREAKRIVVVFVGGKRLNNVLFLRG